MEHLVIVADLGHFRAYRVVSDEYEMESDRIELLESHDPAPPHMKTSEKLSDSAGRFRRAGGAVAGGAGFGERHTLNTEERRRLIHEAAADINAMVRTSGCGQWWLAADSSINARLLECLDPAVRDCLARNVKANLTHMNKQGILQRFH